MHVSRLDPSGTDQVDAKHPTRRRVEGSNPPSDSKTAGQTVLLALLAVQRRQAIIPLGRVIAPAPFAVLVCRPHPG
jgi:hypothetical protein